MRRKLLFSIAGIAILYSSGYCVARSRKFIVMHEPHFKDERIVVRRTGPGRDLRENWIGRMKNELNPVVYTFFRPMCCVEDYVRGSTEPRRY